MECHFVLRITLLTFNTFHRHCFWKDMLLLNVLNHHCTATLFGHYCIWVEDVEEFQGLLSGIKDVEIMCK